MKQHLSAPLRRKLSRLKWAIFRRLFRRAATVLNSNLWDDQWYLNQLEQRPQSPLRHYLRHGGESAVSPHPLFDAHYYLSQNTDVAEKQINPLIHYLTWGHLEGRKPNPLFADRWYRERYQDVMTTDGAALIHFATWGWQEGRDPHPLFHTHWYLAQNPDVAASGMNPLAHYLRFGEREGRRPNPLFDPVYYRRNGEELTEFTGCLLEHYDAEGAAKGYAPSWEFSAESHTQDDHGSENTNASPLERHFQQTSVANKTGRSLNAAQWLAMFGHPTSHELTVLQQGVNDRKVSNRILVLADPADVAIGEGKPSQALEFAVQSTPPSSLDEFDAVLICGTAMRIFPDAVGIGLLQLQRQSENCVYFDEAIRDPATDDLKLLFKPDWSPEFFRQGGMPHQALLVAPTPENLLLLNTFKPVELLALPQALQSQSPHHVPLVALEAAAPSAATNPPTSTHSVESSPLVSIIIPSKDQYELLKTCISSLLSMTAYPQFEILIIDNGTRETQARNYLKQLHKEQAEISVIAWDKPFNFSELCNVGAEHARGEYLCFLNNDIEITQADWLNRLISAVSQDDCGAAGATLLYPDGTIQHGGVIMGPGGVAANALVGNEPDVIDARYSLLTREVSAVSGACLITPAKVFEQVKGFDAVNLAVSFNDVDYCLRLGELGLFVRHVASARLVHHESASLVDHAKGRGPAFQAEVRYMQQRWRTQIRRDPYHNINLCLDGKASLKPNITNERWRYWHELGVQPRTLVAQDAMERRLRLYEDDNQSRIRTVNYQHAVTETQAETPRNGLAIIILTKDRPEFIVPLIKSLAAAEPAMTADGQRYRVLIGDTGSTHPKVLRLYEQLPSCCQLFTGLDYQFSRCNNALWRHTADFSHVLFLNNDIEFSDVAHSLKLMRARLDAADGPGIIGAVLDFPDGTVQHQGMDVFKDAPLRGFVYHPGTREKTTLTPNEFRPCPGVTGALLMAKQEALLAIGGFDETFNAECQDADLCLAAARLGFPSEVIHAGKIIHFENGTRPKGEEHWADRRRFMRKWSNWIEANYL